MEVTTMAKKKRMPERKRCKRCGLLWPRFAGRICRDCEHQIEIPLTTALVATAPGLAEGRGRR
jgi:hypothetical protein